MKVAILDDTPVMPALRSRLADRLPARAAHRCGEALELPERPMEKEPGPAGAA